MYIYVVYIDNVASMNSVFLYVFVSLCSGQLYCVYGFFPRNNKEFLSSFSPLKTLIRSRSILSEMYGTLKEEIWNNETILTQVTELDLTNVDAAYFSVFLCIGLFQWYSLHRGDGVVLSYRERKWKQFVDYKHTRRLIKFVLLTLLFTLQRNVEHAT